MQSKQHDSGDDGPEDYVNDEVSCVGGPRKIPRANDHPEKPRKWVAIVNSADKHGRCVGNQARYECDCNSDDYSQD